MANIRFENKRIPFMRSQPQSNSKNRHGKQSNALQHKARTPAIPKPLNIPSIVTESVEHTTLPQRTRQGISCWGMNKDVPPVKPVTKHPVSVDWNDIDSLPSEDELPFPSKGSGARRAELLDKASRYDPLELNWRPRDEPEVKFEGDDLNNRMMELMSSNKLIVMKREPRGDTSVSQRDPTPVIVQEKVKETEKKKSRTRRPQKTSEKSVTDERNSTQKKTSKRVYKAIQKPLNKE